MGVYRHLVENPASLSLFGGMYNIPANVEVRLDTFDDGWMPFWLVTIVEAGVWFPLHPLLRNCLEQWNLSPC